MKYAIVFKLFLNSDDLIRMEDHEPHFFKENVVLQFLRGHPGVMDLGDPFWFRGITDYLQVRGLKQVMTIDDG